MEAFNRKKLSVDTETAWRQLNKHINYYEKTNIS